MKSAVIVGAMLSSFYMLGLHLVMSQVNAMENFYSHMDTYATQAVNNQSNTPIKPQPLQDMMNPKPTSQSLLK